MATVVVRRNLVADQRRDLRSDHLRRPRDTSRPAILSDELRARTIIINSLSKTYAMTGWRVGYCAAPAPIIERMFLVLQQSSRGPATFVQDAADRGARADRRTALATCATSTQARRQLVLTALAGMPGVRVLAPEGGFFAMLDVRRTGRAIGRDSPAAAARARRRRRSRRCVRTGGAKAHCACRSRSGGDTLARGLDAAARRALAALMSHAEGHLGTDPVPAPMPAAWIVAGLPPRARHANVTGEVAFRQGLARALLHRRQRLSDRAARRGRAALTRDLIRPPSRSARAFGCPLTMRGGGTSQAGQAIGPGLVVDTSKYLQARSSRSTRGAVGARRAGHACSTS